MEMLHTTPLHLSALDDGKADAGDDKAAPHHRKDCHNGQRILCDCWDPYKALIKNRRQYWPVDAHFASLEIGNVDTLKQVLDGKNFLLHCQKDDGYVTKIITTHGTLREIDDHHTRRVVNGQVKTFCYVKPISRHNLAKHFVNDVNNRRHDPIGLDQGWPAKRWDHCQFAFFSSAAEANAVNSQA